MNIRVSTGKEKGFISGYKIEKKREETVTVTVLGLLNCNVKYAKKKRERDKEHIKPNMPQYSKHLIFH